MVEQKQVGVKPEFLIVATGLILIGLVVWEMLLIQATFENVQTPAVLTDVAVWDALMRDRELLLRFSAALILLVIAMFIGLALVQLHNRRTAERMNAELEKKIQDRTAQLGYERNLLRTLIDNVPDLIYAKDSNSKFVVANNAVAQMFGFHNAEELLGKSDFDFFSRELAEQFRADEIQVMQSGVPLIGKLERYLTRDGREGWNSTNKVPLRDPQGNLIGLVGVGRDVTQVRRQSEKLRERESMLAKAQEIAHVGSWRWDPQSDAVEWSEEMYRIYGIEPMQFEGTSASVIANAVHPDDRARLEMANEQARQGTLTPLEYRVVHPDGQERVVWAEGEFLRDANGNPLSMVGVVQDITERKRAQAAQQQLAAIVESSDDAIVSKTLEGIVTSWNRGAERLHGYTASEMIGQPISKIIPPERIAESLAAQERLVQGGQIVHLETQRFHKNGTRVEVALTLSPMYDEAGAMIGSSVIARDITRRRRAEDELRRQNEYLDALHETTINLMGRLQLNDLLQAITQRAANLVGTENGYIYLNELGSEEMQMSVGIGIFSQMVGSMARRGIGATGIVWETGELFVVDDYRTWGNRLNKPGTTDVRGLVSIPLKSEDKVVGVFGVAYTDENKKFDAAAIQILTRFAHLASIALDNARLYAAARQELAERTQAEERFRRLFAASPDAILLLDPADPEWRIVDCNQVACEMNGYSRDELIGQPIDLLNIARDTPQERAKYLEEVRRAGVMHVESEHRHKDGHPFTIETSTSLLKVGDHELVLGIDRNVTERKRVENDLRESRELLQTIFDNCPVMIGMIDANGHYTLINHEWERTLGYTLDEMNDGDVLAAMYPDAEQQRAARNFMFSPTPGWHDFKTVVRDGRTVDTSWMYKPLLQGMTLAFGQDITQRKQVDRLKNEFISTVSHELRTPLTSIRGSLGLIAGGVAGPMPERAKSMIDIAYKNSERLVRLINDILDIEKIESGKMAFQLRPIELVPLLEQAVEANRAFGAQYHVTFEIIQAPGDVQINADPDRITQVMTNLLSNAAKFSPPHSQVEIRVTQNEKVVRVAVHDDGAGIPEEFKNQIFQKFAQADSSDTRQKGGTGLGLSIAKAIVEKHGGTIGFDSVDGHGTTFYFQLPEYQPMPLQEAVKPRILVVDDDRDVAMILYSMLKQGGFDADVAFNAAQALELAQTRSYAAVTLDLMLPDRDGLSVIREFRSLEATRNLPIVVVSAKAEQGKRQLNGDAMWVADWLQKPIDLQELVRAVAHATAHLRKGKPHILHIEDDADVLQVVKAILHDIADVSAAMDFQHARALLERNMFDLVILDPMLPDGSGTELFPLLRRGGMQIPIVIFSAREQDQNILNHVNAALVKSRTSNEQLLKTIAQLIEPARIRGEP